MSNINPLQYSTGQPVLLGGLTPRSTRWFEGAVGLGGVNRVHEYYASSMIECLNL
jgi:hypothetical protein